MGIKTPKAHRLIVEGQRQGIIYDRISGEALSVKFSDTNKPAFDTWMEKFVVLHKQIMQHHIDGAMPYKDFLKMFATDEETIFKINALADDDCFIHGDFHLENVMVDKENNLVLIDMMNVCKGPILYDVARTYFLLSYDNNVQRKYLKQIGYTLDDIMPYLDVILAVRNNEMKKI